MDKYEYRVKTEQMLEYMEKRQYKKAMEIADTIDWRRVKNASMLNNVSEIYEYNGEYQKSRDILFVAYDRSPGSRKIVYRLGILALKINDIEEASDCYEEFVKLAPKDPNQYILKYKILKARRAPVSEQIAALEDFKKAEYVEKWAYELAKLYDEAGMTAECLEECDDLILWFSEGKYVYQAMELKMKYKPLTPLQQEKYNSMGGQKTGRREMVRASAEEDVKPQEAEEEMQDELEEAEDSLEQEDIPEVKESGTLSEEEAATREIRLDELRAAQEKAKEEMAAKPKEKSSIRQTVKGATLSEALANGVRVAKGLDIEEKASTKQDEAMRITGQMKIEEILAEWEAKQKGNAEAIEEQRKKDEEKLAQRRLEAQRRREEEARRIEEQQRAAEEARKIAEQKAAEEARRLAEQKAEEERILAKQKADEEKRLAKLKEEEEEALLDRIASGKATEEFKEAVRNAVEPEEEPEEVIEEMIEEEPDEPVEEVVEEITEEEIAEEEDEPDEPAEEVMEESAAEEIFEEADEPEEMLNAEVQDEEEIPEESQDMSMTADLRQLMAELEAEDQPEDKGMNLGGLSIEEPADEEVSDYIGEEESYDEADYDEVDYDESGFEEDDGFEGDDDFEDEDDFEDDYEDEYVEDDYEDDYADEYEDEYEDNDLEDDMDDDSFDEDDYSDYDDIEDDDYDDDFYDDEEEETKPKKKQQEELVIEEPTEEEIQKRIKKGKGGVPFDTGFVVTGRYDLSATSEIGLKAGLTEEQKQLFSYFVPVRGMSEQIVEVLDNDRRERRNGTSKVGNILVIGHKGSGKTVLAVDIVKAIQKQRNLKQGKVAIVTGEALNKKDIPNIIQKLKGGAIIIEKAGKLNARTVRDLNILMEKKTGELLFVLEDQRKALERLFTANPEFKKKFTSKLELPVFVNDELVTFGQTYAKENGYKLDEMGILALYSRIDVMQREDHAVTVAEVKEIMDAAIEHSQKANVKHLARRMFRKGTDESDRIILKEDDFKI